MKKAPADAQLQERLGQTKFSADGFLGSDTRALDEIIADDRRACDRLGVAPEKIAHALSGIYAAAEARSGVPVEISPSLLAAHIDAKGAIPSPFPGEGRFDKGETIITSRVSGEEFHVTRLSIHLIAVHGFFQGTGSRYRIEPAAIVSALGLLPKDQPQ